MLFSLSVLTMATFLVASAAEREPTQPTAAMKADVDRLVVQAEKIQRLWPWPSALPDVERVVRHGRRVAPLLVALLDDDPDAASPGAPAWTVQQQAALALCRIFGVSEECGRIYCNRATQEVNRGVRRFWLAKISEASEQF